MITEYYFDRSKESDICRIYQIGILSSWLYETSYSHQIEYEYLSLCTSSTFIRQQRLVPPIYIKSEHCSEVEYWAKFIDTNSKFSHWNFVILDDGALYLPYGLNQDIEVRERPTYTKFDIFVVY